VAVWRRGATKERRVSLPPTRSHQRCRHSTSAIAHYDLRTGSQCLPTFIDSHEGPEDLGAAAPRISALCQRGMGSDVRDQEFSVTADAGEGGEVSNQMAPSQTVGSSSNSPGTDPPPSLLAGKRSGSTLLNRLASARASRISRGN